MRQVGVDGWWVKASNVYLSTRFDGRLQGRMQPSITGSQQAIAACRKLQKARASAPITGPRIVRNPERVPLQIAAISCAAACLQLVLAEASDQLGP